MTTLRVAYLIGAILLTAGYAQGPIDLFVFVPFSIIIEIISIRK